MKANIELCYTMSFLFLKNMYVYYANFMGGNVLNKEFTTRPYDSMSSLACL